MYQCKLLVTNAWMHLHPPRQVPVIFFGHGASSFLELQKDMAADMICIDWRVDMAAARGILGDKPVSGNVDPTVLLGPPDGIVAAVDECIHKVRRGVGVCVCACGRVRVCCVCGGKGR